MGWWTVDRPSSPSDAFPPDATLADAGEFGLIGALTALFEPGEGVLVGPGDDAAVLRIRTGHVVVSTDLMVEGRHFRRGWASAEDVGHRAAAQNLSDVNAMGGRATALTIGLAAPADLPVRWALDFAKGFADECALVGATVIGGDLTRARALVEAYRRPEPPYDAGRAAAEAGATAMIDISDGLLAEAGHLAEDSGVTIDIASSTLEISEPLVAVGAALGAEPLSFVLGGGDDHALLATFPADVALPEGWRAIGTVAAGSGVTVDGTEYDGPAGWTHF